MGYKLVEPALDAQLPESDSPKTGLVKTVLIAICARADNVTHDCYPSISDLVRRAQVSRNTVKRSIYLLESYGLITVQRRKVEGSEENTSNLYKINLEEVGAMRAEGRPKEDRHRAKESRGLAQGEPLGRAEEGHKSVNESVNESVIQSERGKHPFPSDFCINSDMKKWFVSKGFKFDIDEVTEKFIDHALANGRKQFDWIASWRNWMKKEYTPNNKKSNAKAENFSGYGETQF